MKKEKKLRKRNRWTKNDTELTILALPTAVWYILFCFLPMFGLIIAFKNYRVTAEKASFTMFSTVTGQVLKTSNS